MTENTRVTFRVERDVLEEVDELVENSDQYRNRSEALREGIDLLLGRDPDRERDVDREKVVTDGGTGAAGGATNDDHREREFVERHGHVNEITAGTVLEYDGWQWALVTELDVDREEPKIGFILMDEVGDHIVQHLEQCDGCRQHYNAVEHLRGGDHEYWAPVEYVLEDDIWSVLGPIHPDFREGGDGDLRTDGGFDPAAQAAAAVRNKATVPEVALVGTNIGECPDCGARFDYGRGTDTRNLDPCPDCGSHDWTKWGYRHDGEEVPASAVDLGGDGDR